MFDFIFWCLCNEKRNYDLNSIKSYQKKSMFVHYLFFNWCFKLDNNYCEQMNIPLYNSSKLNKKDSDQLNNYLIKCENNSLVLDKKRVYKTLLIMDIKEKDLEYFGCITKKPYKSNWKIMNNKEIIEENNKIKIESTNCLYGHKSNYIKIKGLKIKKELELSDKKRK